MKYLGLSLTKYVQVPNTEKLQNYKILLREIKDINNRRNILLSWFRDSVSLRYSIFPNRVIESK